MKSKTSVPVLLSALVLVVVSISVGCLPRKPSGAAIYTLRSNKVIAIRDIDGSIAIFYEGKPFISIVSSTEGYVSVYQDWERGGVLYYSLREGDPDIESLVEQRYKELGKGFIVHKKSPYLIDEN
jgi:hypothetical protein